MACAAIEVVITISPVQPVLAVTALQHIRKATPEQMVVAIEAIDPVHHVPKPTQPVIPRRRSSHHRTVPQIPIAPHRSIGKLKVFDAMHRRGKIVIHPQSITVAVVQIQLRAMALHQLHIRWGHIAEQHHITVPSRPIHIHDLFLVPALGDHIHIIPLAAIQIIVAAARYQPVTARTAQHVVMACAAIEQILAFGTRKMI